MRWCSAVVKFQQPFPVVSALKLSHAGWQAPDIDGWLLFLLAPFEYAPLVGGAIAGYLIWGEVPDRWVSVNVPGRKTGNLSRCYLQSHGNPIEKVDLQYADDLIAAKHIG